MMPMAIFSLPSPRITILADWAKFTNREPMKTTFRYLSAWARISPFAPERERSPVVKISPTAVIIRDSRMISAIRFPMIRSTVPWSFRPMARESTDADPVPTRVATPLFSRVKG